MDDDLREIVEEFLAESHENLDRLDADLVALEAQPGAAELLGRIFRTFHTLKGTSGYLGFATLEGLTHAGEELLVQLRDGARRLDQELTTALLELVDAVRRLLDAIEATGEEGPADTGELLTRLRALATAPAEPARPPSRLGDVLLQWGRVTPEDVARALLEQEAGDERPLGQILVDRGAVSAPDVIVALATQAGRRGGETQVRVEAALLDELVQAVGELAASRDVIVRHALGTDDPDLLRAAQRFDLVSGRLDELAARTSVQPVEQVWSRLPRLVRDLAVACDKAVRLETEGSQTELDRGLLEALRDPLVHLVRNAVDHGIEPAAARLAAGKPPEGLLLLRATRTGREVVLDVVDDGAGIDPRAVAAKALERGLCSAPELAEMSETDVLALVFRPGFSTAATVTSVSGRGVGMDVVKNNIESLGGRVEAHSTLGSGTTFRLRLPAVPAAVAAAAVGAGVHA